MEPFLDRSLFHERQRVPKRSWRSRNFLTTVAAIFAVAPFAFGTLHLLTLTENSLTSIQGQARTALASAASSPLSGIDAAANSFYRWICPYIRTCDVGNSLQPEESLALVPVTAAPVTTILPAPNAPSKALSPAPQTIINQPVIERIIEREAPQDLSIFTVALNKLENDFSQRLAAVASSIPSAQQFVSTPVFAQSQRVDQLSNVTLTNPNITGGSVEASSVSGTISNIIESALATVDSLVAADASFTRATTTDFAATNASLTHATTTSFAVTGTATSSFGGGILAEQFTATATSTLAGLNLEGSLRLLAFNCTSFANGGTLTTDANGNVTCAADDGGSGGSVGGSNGQIQFNDYGSFAGDAGLTYSTSTSRLTASNASFSTATATAFFATNASTTNATSTNLFSTSVRFTTALADTINSTSATISNLNATNASSSLASVYDAIYVGRTATTTIRGDGVASVLPYASSTAITVSGLASTSDLIASNSFTFKTVTGFLKATAGAVATALIDLASDVTGILPVANGGTGWSAFQSGTVLLGNGAGQIATTTRGSLAETGSSILTITGGANAVLGNGTTIQVSQAGASNPGFLSSTDWTTFNNKIASSSLSGGTGISYNSSTGVFTNTGVTSLLGTANQISASGSTGAITLSLPSLLSISQASSTQLSALDALYIGRTATTSIRGDGMASVFPYASTTALTISGTGYFPGSGIWNSSGNVGIGTTTPQKTLEVTGQLRVADASQPGYALIEVGRSSTASNNWHFGSEGDGTFRWYNGNLGAGTERMRITSSGNVGIGTTLPGAKLHVVGNLAVSGSSILGGVGFAPADTTPTQVQGLSLGYADTAGYGWFQSYNGKPLALNPVGNNVGIGTTNPDNGKLEVKGGTVCVDTNSDDNASSCIASESDARLKTNIQEISASTSLDIINVLNPVSFDWRANDPDVLAHYPLLGRYASSTHSIGLIAQEVMPVLPEALSLETVGDDEVQYFQLDYTKFIPHLIGAVKELLSKVQILGQKVTALFDSVEAQNERIQALEARVRELESQYGAANVASPTRSPDETRNSPDAPSTPEEAVEIPEEISLIPDNSSVEEILDQQVPQIEQEQMLSQ